MKKKKPEEEVCLAIPPWSKIQAPQIGINSTTLVQNLLLAVMLH